jgi:membrane protein required for colicin V production
MLDILFLIAIGFAVYKGYTRGFIMSIFAVLGFIVGLAAALKLSATVASKLSTISDATRFLPMLAFAFVFIATAFAVRFAGKMIQKTFETVMLGWANRLAGIALFVLLYSIIFSIFIFYAIQIHLINQEAANASSMYPYYAGIGPKVMEGIGVVIPWFKNMFGELQQFFGKFAQQPA